MLSIKVQLRLLNFTSLLIELLRFELVVTVAEVVFFVLIFDLFFLLICEIKVLFLSTVHFFRVLVIL